MERYRHRLVLDVDALRKGLDELAARLSPQVQDREVTAIPVLGGAMIFAADLVRRLPPGLVMDFIRVRSYGDATAPQRPPQADWVPRDANVSGRTVLLIDDILDTGRTLRAARALLLERMGAAEVITVVLVDKPARRAVSIEPDERVLLLEEDLFLVGYGLDYAGRYRNVPELMALELDEDGRPLERIEAPAGPQARR